MSNTTDIKEVTMHYRIRCDDGQQYEFEGIGDDQAREMSKDKFPAQEWELFRLMDDKEVPVGTSKPQNSH